MLYRILQKSELQRFALFENLLRLSAAGFPFASSLRIVESRSKGGAGKGGDFSATAPAARLRPTKSPIPYCFAKDYRDQPLFLAPARRFPMGHGFSSRVPLPAWQIVAILLAQRNGSVFPSLSRQEVEL